jgi:hypothetical protein
VPVSSYNKPYKNEFYQKESCCQNCAWFIKDTETCRVYETGEETPVDPEFKCHKWEGKKKSNTIKDRKPKTPISEEEYEILITKDNIKKGKF